MVYIGYSYIGGDFAIDNLEFKMGKNGLIRH